MDFRVRRGWPVARGLRRRRVGAGDAAKVGLDDAASKYLAAFAKVSVITSFDEKTGA